MTELQHVIATLIAEGDSVDRLVADIDDAQWSLPTPAPGWAVRHQVAHLSFIFRLATAAAAAPEMFKAIAAKSEGNFDRAVNAALAEYENDTSQELLARWRADRAKGEQALNAVPATSLVPWLVRPIPAGVLAAAGMMELVAHGQDIADALGRTREWTDRIKYVVGFAVQVWDFGYLARGLKTPDVQFGFELTAPSGAIWRFGPEDAAQRITGSAVDFCLLATRRRHRADVDLVAVGADADHWLDIAQAYRGGVGAGRSPGQFRGEAQGLVA
ncbi:MAG TPA: TIGR03084 family metal-binding protein [Pseudonocardiaceae bacterium]|nr:TIGR03084 family metal-binding protein [Pseudonocardiaceae bacterium]